MEAQVGLSNIEDRKAKISSDTSLKNLLKNWQFMSSVIIYCVFSLHDVAYLEVIFFLYDHESNFCSSSTICEDANNIIVALEIDAN